MEQKYKDDTMMAKNVNGVFVLKDIIVQIFYIFVHFQVYVDTNSFIKDKYYQKGASHFIFANSAKLFPRASQIYHFTKLS